MGPDRHSTNVELNSEGLKPSFDLVSDGLAKQPPSKPKATLELTIGGTVEQYVHAQVERQKVPKRTRPTSYAAKMSMRREFKREAKNAQDRCR